MTPLNPSYNPIIPSAAAAAAPNEWGESAIPNQHDDANIKAKALHILYDDHLDTSTLEPGLFSKIQASTVIRNHEDATTKSSLEYWLHLINHWIEGKDLIINPGLSKKELFAVKQSLEDCRSLLKVKNPEKFKESVQSKLTERGSCYIPTGWTGSPGHFMIAKFEKKEGVIAIQLMTKGGGAQYHNQFEGLHKTKVNYKSDTIYITEKTLFQSNLGESFFKRLLSLEHTRPSNMSQDYGAEDLYGLFNLMAEKNINTTPEENKGFPVTPQRSGNCTDTGLRMTLYEAIMDSEDPTRTAKDHKRALYAFKLQTLVEGFQKFLPDLAKGDENLCHLIGHAAREHLIRINKLFPEIINQEEASLGFALGEEILRQVQLGYQVNTLQKPVHLLPNIACESSSQGSFQPEKTRPINYEYEPYYPVDPIALVAPATFKPDTVLKSLQLFKSELSRVEDTDWVHFKIEEVFESLPLPNGEKVDPFWSLVPDDDKGSCISILADLCGEAFKRSPLDPRLKVTFAIAYDISCQLARHLPELKMDAVSFPIKLPQLQQLTTKSTQILKTIEQNFKKRESFSDSKLFPRTVSYEKNPHWDYLEQFFTLEIRDYLVSCGLETTKFNDEVKNTFVADKAKQYFPSSFYALHSLAVLNNFFEEYSGFANREKYTSDLWALTHYDIEEGGRPHLGIDGYFDGLPSLGLRNTTSISEEIVKFHQTEAFRENTILTNRYKPIERVSDPKLSEIQLQELLLLSGPHKVFQTINWAESHFNLLREPIVKKFIEEYLLDFKNVSDVFAEIPEVAALKVSQFVSKGLDFYKKEESDRDTLLWFSFLGSYLKGFISYELLKNHSAPNISKTLSTLENKTLQPAEKLKIIYYRIFTFFNKTLNNYNSDDINELAVLGLNSHYLFYSDAPFKSIEGFEAKNVLTRSYTLFQDYFKKSSTEDKNLMLNQILNEFLADESAPQRKWEGKGNLVFVADGYSLDLGNLLIYKDLVRVSNAASSAAIDNNYKAIFKDWSFKCVLKEGYYYKLPAEDYRISLMPLKIQKLTLIDGSKQWLEFSPPHQNKLFTPNPILNKFQLWKSITDNPVVYAFDPVSHKVGFIYHSNEGWRISDPLTDKPLPQRLVDLVSDTSERKDWINFLNRFEPAEEILLYEIEDSPNHWSIQKIEMPRLNLSFMVVNYDGKNCFKCKEVDGFYLSEDQTQNTQDLPGSILLEDKATQQKRLLYPLKAIKPFSRPEATFHILFIDDGEKPYYTYLVKNDLSSLNLAPESPQAALFLSLILRGRKNYEGAIRYLKESENLEGDSFIEWKMIENLLLNADRSKIPQHPSLSAFDLHLVLRMNRHANKFTKKNLHHDITRETRLAETKNKLNELGTQQSIYYHATTSELKSDVTVLPKSLKLSLEDEKSFPYAPRSRSRADPDDLFDIMKPVDYNSDFSLLLSSVTQPKITGFSPQELMSVDFVRLPASMNSYKYLTYNFFELHNKALEASKDPLSLKLFKMDLFFLWRNDKQNHKDDKKRLIEALYFIATYPSYFSSFESSPLSPQEKIEKFIEILKKYDDSLARLVSAKEGEKASPSDSATVADVNKTNSLASPLSPRYSLKSQTFAEPSLVNDFEKYTLKLYFDRLFTINKNRPFQDEPFAIESFKPENKIAQKMRDHLRLGHSVNQKVKVKEYVLKSDAELKSVKEELIQRLGLKEVDLNSLNQKIEELANKPFEESEQNLISKIRLTTKLESRLTLENSLLICFISNDFSNLQKLNPALQPEDIFVIKNEIATLLVLGRDIKILEEAIHTCTSIENDSTPESKQSHLQQLGKILNTQSAYDLQDHPEFLAYEYATGMVLRKDQVELLDWVIKSSKQDNLNNLLFQFQAGGGKTKVLMPLLAMKLAEEGFFPVLVNHSPLYDTGKRDLDRSLNAAFKQHAELLEIELGTKILDEQYVEILTMLKKLKNDKKCLIVKSETIYALILARKESYERKDVNKAALISEIFDFLKSNSVALIDEAHLTLDSLQESNQASGEGEKLSLDHQSLLIDFTKILLGTHEESPIAATLRDKVKLAENQQGSLTDNDYEQIRQMMIPIILSFPIWDSVDIPKDELLIYFKDLKAPMPVFMKEFSRSVSESKQDMYKNMAFTKKYLHLLMPFSLSLVQENSYGESKELNDFTVSRHHDKNPEKSKFQNSEITALLTVHNAFQEKLTIKGLREILTKLSDQHTIEKEFLSQDKEEITPTQEFFNKAWSLGNTSFVSSTKPVDTRAPSLDSLDIQDPTFLNEAKLRLGSDTTIIEFFLKNIALPQIRVFSEKISATPPDLMEAFGKTISFTATLGLMEMYPAALQQDGAVKADPGFEASVMQVLAKPENKKIVFGDFNDLDLLFENLYQQDSEALIKITALIDSGGLFRGASNREIIEKFLLFMQSKGVKVDGGIFKQDWKAGTDQGKLGILTQVSHSNDHDSPFEVQTLSGSDLPRAIKEIGKNFDDISLITLFGLEDTTGADLKQPSQGQALLTVGELQTKTKTIQAAMRMRSLLAGNDSQTVVWAVSSAIAGQIKDPATKEALSVPEIFNWLIQNEALVMEKSIVMRAYQGIHHLVQKSTWNKIYQAPIHEQNKLYQKHRKGLVDFIDHNPASALNSSQKEETIVTLRSYALSCYHLLGYTDNKLKELPQKDKEAILLLMNQTKELIENLDKSTSESASGMLQHQEQRQEQKQEQKQEMKQQASSRSDKLEHKPSAPLPNFIKGRFLFPLSSSFSESIKSIFYITKLPLSPKIEGGKELFTVYKQPDKSPFEDSIFKLDFGMPQDSGFKMKMNIPELPKANVLNSNFRPFDHILLIQDKATNEYRYIICTKEESDKSRPLLLGETVDKNDDVLEKVVLIDLKGQIIQNGKGQLGFNLDELESIKNNREIKKQLCLIAFLNGRLLNLPLLHEMTSHLSDYELDSTWSKINLLNIGPFNPDHAAFDRLKKIRTRALTLATSVSQSNQKRK